MTTINLNDNTLGKSFVREDGRKVTIQGRVNGWYRCDDGYSYNVNGEAATHDGYTHKLIYQLDDNPPLIHYQEMIEALKNELEKAWKSAGSKYDVLIEMIRRCAEDDAFLERLTFALNKDQLHKVIKPLQILSEVELVQYIKDNEMTDYIVREFGNGQLEWENVREYIEDAGFHEHDELFDIISEYIDTDRMLDVAWDRMSRRDKESFIEDNKEYFDVDSIWDEFDNDVKREKVTEYLRDCDDDEFRRLVTNC